MVVLFQILLRFVFAEFVVYGFSCCFFGLGCHVHYILLFINLVNTNEFANAIARANTSINAHV